MALLLGLLLLAAPSRARAEGEPEFPFEDIATTKLKHPASDVYFPAIETWPVPDIVLFPILFRTASGEKKLSMRLILEGITNRKQAGLTLTIDGSSVELNESLQSTLLTSGSGCEPFAMATLDNQDDLIRRLAGASQVQITYHADKLEMKSALTLGDLVRFRRILALYDRKDWPSEKATQSSGDPVLKKSSPPIYPEKARKMHKSGEAFLVAKIMKDGTIGALRAAKLTADDCEFIEAAAEAVRHWKYLPATRDGQPAETDLVIVTTFELR